MSVALRVHTAVHVHDTCPLSEHGLPTARRAQAQDPVQGQPSEAVGEALQSQPWGSRVPSEALGRLGPHLGVPGTDGRPIPAAGVPAWSWLSAHSPRWPGSQDPQERRPLVERA